jgi:hypothetical protein
MGRRLVERMGSHELRFGLDPVRPPRGRTHGTPTLRTRRLFVGASDEAERRLLEERREAENADQAKDDDRHDVAA